MNLKKQIALLSITLLLFSSCASKPPINTESSSSKFPINIEPSSSLNDIVSTNDTIPDLLLCYHGHLKTTTLRSNTYDIKVYGDKTDGVAFYVEFSFKFPDSADQSFRHSLENFPHIDSIHQGIAILDVNGDNNDDIILDFGENGHQDCVACFVFSPFEYQYIAVSDFTALASPKIALSSNNELVIISENKPGYLNYPPINSFDGWLKYKIENSNLIFITSLDDISNLTFIF